MSTPFPQQLTALMHQKQAALRAALWRALTIGLAVLIGCVGAGFLLAAVFVVLRGAIGSGPAALVIGAVLLLVSAVLVLLASRETQPASDPASAGQPATQPPAPATAPTDIAAMAVFTAAFVVGRCLADTGRR